MFVVESHKRLDGEETDAEMLAVGNNVVADDVFINARASKIFLLEFLNNCVVDYVACLRNNFVIRVLSGADDDV
jgi:hypothetical protein